MSEKSFLEKAKEMSAAEKEELIEKIEETAWYNKKTYGGCCRCVLTAIQEGLKLGGELLFKAADPMTGGVARNGEACGSMTGGVLAIGLAYGRDSWESFLAPWEGTSGYRAMPEAQARAMKFADAFKKHYGSLRCRDVQKAILGRSWDLTNPEESEEFIQPEYHDKCGDVAKVAAHLATEIILEP